VLKKLFEFIFCCWRKRMSTEDLLGVIQLSFISFQMKTLHLLYLKG
jgi:hypothetical protein